MQSKKRGKLQTDKIQIWNLVLSENGKLSIVSTNSYQFAVSLTPPGQTATVPLPK